MLREVVSATSSGDFRVGLVATTFGFGFRHGIDWDHIAAITDIAGSQASRRTSMFFSTLYALGHGLVVFALCSSAIVLSERLPTGVDKVMERFVGMTLLLLGVYVFISVARHGRDFRMRSRWMLLICSARQAARWWARRGHDDLVFIDHDHVHRASAHHGPDPALAFARRATHSAAEGTPAAAPTQSHPHHHLGVAPQDPFTNYGRATAFGVGMVHGIGAETPTQVLLVLAAAGAGGKTAGMALLGFFLAGLLVSNSLLALLSTLGFVGASRSLSAYVAVSVVTATFSIVIGGVFVLGRGTVLPAVLGG